LGNCGGSLSCSQIVCLLPESYSTIKPSAATCGIPWDIEKIIFTSGLAMGDSAVSLARLPLLHSECSASRIPPWREAGIKLTCCQRPTRKWYTGGQYSTTTMDVPDYTLFGRAHAAELGTINIGYWAVRKLGNPRKKATSLRGRFRLGFSWNGQNHITNKIPPLRPGGFNKGCANPESR
jgi:hypothetical protein